MNLGKKERVVVLAALRQYMTSIETALNNNKLSEYESSELVNDAALLEIVVSKFEEEVSSK